MCAKKEISSKARHKPTWRLCDKARVSVLLSHCSSYLASLRLRLRLNIPEAMKTCKAKAFIFGNTKQIEQ